MLLSFLVVVSACSASEPVPTLASGTTAAANLVATGSVTQSGESTSSAPLDPTLSASSAAPSTTVFDPAVPIPETEGEDNIEVIWRELIEYHNWAFQNPELADAELYLSKDCECFANAQERLDEYRRKGWRETSPGLTVHEVDVDIATGNLAVMTIVDEHSPLVVVDAVGLVVRERERRPKTFFDVRVRLFDGGWRIVEWVRRGAVGDAE